MSDVKLNVNKFKELIEKGTLAHSIECLQLHFVEQRVQSNMVSNQRDVVVLLDMPNDVIEFSEQDDITFNFAEPYIQILPYFTVIDEPEAQIEIVDENDNFIIKSGVGQRAKVPFCHLSSIQNNVLYKSPKDDFDYFATIDIDDNIFKIFNKIKIIGSRFGKIYITVKDGDLLIETTDKTNNFSPELTCEKLMAGLEIENLTLCFEFKNFVNLTKIIEEEMSKDGGKTFKMSFAYIAETEGGLIHVASADATEQYMLLNREI